VHGSRARLPKRALAVYRRHMCSVAVAWYFSCTKSGMRKQSLGRGVSAVVRGGWFAPWFRKSLPLCRDGRCAEVGGRSPDGACCKLSADDEVKEVRHTSKTFGSVCVA